MRRILVLSGAGLSAESGLSTFRGSNGLWNDHRIEQICDGLTWTRHKEAIRRFYNDLRQKVGEAQPNAGHRFLTELESVGSVVHFTQNVDDLSERAGNKTVIHLHGTIREVCCSHCGDIRDVGYSPVVEKRCPLCRKPRTLRPNICFFHENAPNYAVLREAAASLAQGDILIVIGTSGAVVDANAIATMAGDAYKILVNLDPEPTIDEALFDAVIHKPVTEAINDVRLVLLQRFGCGTGSAPQGEVRKLKGSIFRANPLKPPVEEDRSEATQKSRGFASRILGWFSPATQQ